MKHTLVLFCLLSTCLFSQSGKVWMHPNKGQWDERINYKLDLFGGEMYIEQNGFTYSFHNAAELSHKHADAKNEHNAAEKRFVQHVIKTSFIASNLQHSVIEENRSDFYRNYFLGNDPNQWKSMVYSLSKVSYPDFYPGIDMVMESDVSQLKYSFLVQPNSDVSVIRFNVEGAKKIEINKLGELEMEHTYGVISESKPVAWTIDNEGKRTMVPIRFKLANNVVSYHFPEGYDAALLLVIDPNITFSTYTGATTDNWGFTATPDVQGNAFAGGIIFGTGYPVTAGVFDNSFNGGTISGGYAACDVSISKFNSTGTALIYSTFLGGAGNETPHSIVAANNGELYVFGETSSPNFPMPGVPFDPSFNGGPTILVANELGYEGTDIFIARFNASGSSLLSATYLGGTDNDGLNIGNQGDDNDLVYNYGDNFRGEIILDNLGNVIIASTTRSSNFPTVSASQNFLNGIQDAVLCKLSANLSTLIWSTYYGGSGLETGNSVQVSSTNDVYMTGGTTSANLSVPNGHAGFYFGGNSDAYVTRFNAANSSILSGTYLGSSDYDQGFFVQLDIDDFVYVYGQTNGSMNITAGHYGTANSGQFIRKYATNLATVEWTTTIGAGSGSAELSPTAFLVSNCYEIYLAGWGGAINGTDISNFQTTANAFQPSTPNGDCFYIAVLTPDAISLEYATFIGGTSQDHVDGGTSRFDKSGRIYHAVCASCGFTNNGFVSTPGVYSPTENSNNCNLAVFKFELNSINALVTEPNFIICIPNPIQFFNNSTEGDVFFWDFGDNTTSNLADPSHSYTEPGEYTVKLIVSDSEGCKAPDSVSFNISVGSFIPGTIDPTPVICKGVPYQLNATGGVGYQWFPANVLDDPNIPNPTATIFQTTNFSCIISDTCGSDTVFVTLQVFDDFITVSNDTSICLGNQVQISVFNAVSQVWTPNAFINNNTSANPLVSPIVTTDYIVTATTINNCVFKDTVNVNVFFTPPTPDLTDSLIICIGQLEDIHVSGASTYLWSPNQYINTINGPDVIVSPPVDFTYYCDFTNACGTKRDSVYIDVIIPSIRAYNDTIICSGQQANLSVIGAVTYIWSPAISLNSNNAAQVVATPTHTTQYLVIGTDGFGCKDSAYVFVELFPMNPVDAGVDVEAYIGQQVQLNATSNVQGEFSWDPYPYLSCTQCHNPIASPNFNFNYTVYFKDTNGCVTSDKVQIVYPGVIYVPNTFTPDGSKFNEVFKAYGEGIMDFEMLIFNRWGELICTLSSIDDSWDGTYKGKLCQDDTYTWKLTFNDITGEYKTLTGHINLIK